MELSALKGIGPKTEKLFQKIGIKDTDELIRYFPYRYETFPKAKKISDILNSGESVTECVMAYCESDLNISFGGGMLRLSTYIRDDSGRIRVVWFRSLFLKNIIKRGMRRAFLGHVTHLGRERVLLHPRIFDIEEYMGKSCPEPVYRKTKGLTDKMIIKAVKEALKQESPVMEESLPEELLKKRKLFSKRQALISMHFPKNFEEIENSRRRLAYEEAFGFCSAVLKNKPCGKTDYPVMPSPETDRLISSLPFCLTGSQQQAVEDIRNDMSNIRMNRLIQGDVGSGKTITALAAILDTVFSGYQAVLMAPTEILAYQHYEKITGLLRSGGISINTAFLSASKKIADSDDVMKSIEDGTTGIIIGTHALFQARVNYRSLGLVVTDEEHRFGVLQRKSLADKGKLPHILCLSATPIPRTLSKILYKDMDVTRIIDMPEGRKPIKNAVVGTEYREKCYSFMREQMKMGYKCYIICPMIEPDDDPEEITEGLTNVMEYSEEIRKYFPDERIFSLHGKMKNSEKDRIMEEFSQGKGGILVSTTVVEVGVDVKDASVIMIENAERFGLSQLHQLRGRVGRGDFQAYCIFVDCKKTERSKERLNILKEKSDGFLIAEEDLRLRGPGDRFGIRQSGEEMFEIADIYRDSGLFQMASEDAEEFKGFVRLS